MITEFKNKTLLITGGTGSFGNAVLKKFLSSEIAEIRILSRDEKKQDDMRKTYKSDKVSYYLGDVRDFRSMLEVTRGVDFVFHAAALKQVPSCEFYPIEAVKTNILGTENIIEASISNAVKKVVCLSTDKAVYPINAMGISKAMMEKVMIAKSRNIYNEETIICGTRYGNVMASRGSVIPLFLSQIQNEIPITITDPDMTRFMMTLDDAVDLVEFAFQHGCNGDIFVQKSPACTILDLSIAIKKILKIPDYPIDIIGTRHGEKKYEVLLSREERAFCEDMGDYFRITPDLRDLNYSKYIEMGDTVITNSEEYTSHNTSRLSSAEMSNLLKKLDVFRGIESIKDITIDM